MQQLKPMLLIYAILSVLSLVIGWKTYNGLDENLASSLELSNLLQGFDRTTLFDLFNAKKDLFATTFAPIKWIAFMYIIVSIILNSGLLVNVLKEENSIPSLVKNGLKYAVPFLGISILLIITIAIWSAILFVPYTMLLGNPITDYTTELPFLYSLLVVGILWIVGLIWLVTWAVASKISYWLVPNFWKSISAGFISLKTNLFKLTIWGIVLFLFHLILFVISLLFNQMNSASTWTMTILVFVLLQIVVFKKIGVKVFGYAGIHQIINSKK